MAGLGAHTCAGMPRHPTIDVTRGRLQPLVGTGVAVPVLPPLSALPETGVSRHPGTAGKSKGPSTPPGSASRRMARVTQRPPSDARSGDRRPRAVHAQCRHVPSVPSRSTARCRRDDAPRRLEDGAARPGPGGDGIGCPKRLRRSQLGSSFEQDRADVRATTGLRLERDPEEGSGSVARCGRRRRHRDRFAGLRRVVRQDAIDDARRFLRPHRPARGSPDRAVCVFVPSGRERTRGSFRRPLGAAPSSEQARVAARQRHPRTTALQAPTRMARRQSRRSRQHDVLAVGG